MSATSGVKASGVQTRTFVAGGALLLAVALPLLLPDFGVTLLGNIGIFSLVALGLVLLTGVAGSTSFGQAAFMGVGAYTTAILTTRLEWSPWLALLAAFGMTALVALILGAVTLRMSGHYLPLATIAWGISLYYVFGNATDLTGGFTGLREVPPLSVLGVQLTSGRTYVYLILLIVILAAVGVQNLLSSRTGRAIRALRGGSVVAESFGADTYWLRIQTFLVAALLACLAGWLYAHFWRFVNPTPFGLNIGIEFLFMAVLGGSGFVWGALLGAGAITLLKNWLQDILPALFGQAGSYETIFFGLLIILMLQYSRRGLWPILDRLVPPRTPKVFGQAPLLSARSKPANGEEVLRVEHVVKQFGGLRAVNDVSFTLHAGEILGLIGPNGAGKSTMFNLVTGVNPATSGRVVLRGRDVTKLPARAISRLGVGRTFQHVKLFPEMTLVENAMMGGYARARGGLLASMLHLERRDEASLQAEALREIERVGLRDQAWNQAGNLPLGKQRLLEIARALVADPALLLLDEPAAGLRYHEKQELATLLRKLKAEGVTILLVEHDMDLVMNLADRLVVMNYGEKLAEGTPAEVQRHEGVREAYLGGVA
ncbi:ABC transporter permease subunit [Deinococcus yavapaiensis]|uniref:Amino acid/amide ABC transporter membrane protein 2 (HAAT family) /amino acid/amide ABC transporter ATP-binding protein 1 (HAAT family) n=1 Tax=Deinococcus yavapaiensis KR-236 TaxID=694435 RepID=A0A318S745_9DEIO|nr:branched-chain amino acid ABC transporter ATP-binding protein/permease [Deinococcus yavapaiensis]PYE53507.1 amino acid/amide ABC transporter membrane protein 2 (HAAT family) /amino acid/amide ABC transporter ATP-binding protein 1 (HAAT family) [Deinococcus yavapaiensis KR-236]